MMDHNERELLKGLTPAEARFIEKFLELPESRQAEILKEYSSRDGGSLADAVRSVGIKAGLSGSALEAYVQSSLDLFATGGGNGRSSGSLTSVPMKAAGGVHDPAAAIELAKVAPRRALSRGDFLE